MVSMSEGKKAVDAAVESAAELRIPLLTSSLTTAAAFMPIALAKSSTGEYTRPLFQVVTITLLCSWVLSLTMIPLLCVMFLKVKEKRRGRATVAASIGPTAAAAGGLAHRWADRRGRGPDLRRRHAADGLRAEDLLPAQRPPDAHRRAALPTGTPLARSEELVLEVEEFLRDELLLSPSRSRPARRVSSTGRRSSARARRVSSAVQPRARPVPSTPCC